MLEMFKSEREAKAAAVLVGAACSCIGGRHCWSAGTAVLLVGTYTRGSIHPDEVLRYLYILSAVLFILGLKGLSSPKWARRGMFLAEFGMVVAIVGTLFDPRIKPLGLRLDRHRPGRSARSSAAAWACASR